MKKYLLALLLIVPIILSAVVTSHPGSSSGLLAATNGDCSPSFCVTASASSKATPDTATICFTIETKSKELGNAQSENAETTAALMETLADNGITKDNIKTTGFYIFPEYDFYYGQKFIGYKVSNHLSVTSKDIEKVGELIDAISSGGVATVGGIQFSLEDTSSVYNEALLKAVSAAKEKAAALAETSIDALEVVSIKEISNHYFAGTFARFDSATKIMHSDLEISATVELCFCKFSQPKQEESQIQEELQTQVEPQEETQHEEN